MYEWEGIDDVEYLQTWAANATEFGTEALQGQSITLSFDESEGARGTFGRLLGYVNYSENGETKLYNRQMVQQGLARVYGSSFSRHDEFRDLELQARAEGCGLWAESDVDALEPIRNDPIEELYFPKPASVETSWGRVNPARVAVSTAETAEQGDVDGGGGWFPGIGGDTEYHGPIPLVALDRFRNVGVVGAPLVIDDYEKRDGYDIDTSEYDNYAFVTNLIDLLSDRDGDVLIDGGHGQVGADGTAANEDAVVFQRFLEGVDADLAQVNDLVATDLSDYRGIVVTAPPEAFTHEEAAELLRFAHRGGAVVLCGASNAPEGARGNLNDLAADLRTDLRINGDTVTDPESNLDDDETIPVTSNFRKRYDLFDPVPVDEGDDGDAVTEEFTGSLEDGGSETVTYATGTDDPRRVDVELSGPEDADFDLFVTLDGRDPSRTDHDRRSWSYDSEESITLGGGLVGTDTEIGIAVDSYTGSGSYTLTVTER